MRGCTWIATVILIIALVGGIVFVESVNLRAERMEQVWDGSLAEAYPARLTTPAAHRLEELGARLGIDWTPLSLTPASIDAEAERPSSPIHDLAGGYLDAFETDPGSAVPALQLKQFLDSHHEPLLKVADLLRSGQSVRWARDYSKGLPKTMLNYSAGPRMERLLLSQAVMTLATDRKTAMRWFEAAHGAVLVVLDDPELTAQLSGQAMFRRELRVLSHTCLPVEAWNARLAGIDARAGVLRALELASFFALHREWPQRTGWPSEFLSRVWWHDYATRLYTAVEKLRNVDPATFDSEDFVRRQAAALPWWNPYARLLFPNLDVLPRAVRTDLRRELTTIVLTEVAGGTTWNRRPAIIPGLTWVRRVDDAGSVTIELEKEPPFRPSPNDRPLRAHIVMADCR